jgi:hypothetical protein
MRARLGLWLAFCLLALSSLALPAPAMAASLPGGSYINTCSNISLVDGILEATCQRADGSMASAALANAASCSNGVANSNGKLVCTAAPTATTTETSQGFTVFHNTCTANEYVALRPTADDTGLFIILKPGQSVELGVGKGSSYQSSCDGPPTDLTHFAYMRVSPNQ